MPEAAPPGRLVTVTGRSAFSWDSYDAYRRVVYAPDVPLEERRDPELGLLPWKTTLTRFRKRWGNRAVLLADLPNEYLVQGVRDVCKEVWWAAKPLAGVVDLNDLEHRLSDELWTCAQLVIELTKVMREAPEGSPARKVILDQITSRKHQLIQLRDEYKALYAENGADPATVTDAVREALLRAQVLDDDRPIADNVMWAQSLREITAQNRPRTDRAQTESEPPQQHGG